MVEFPKHYIEVDFSFQIGFQTSVKVISLLLCYCIAILCDWLKNLAQLYQPIRSKTKSKRHLPQLERVFPHLVVSSSDWFIGLSASVVIGQSNYFGFRFTTLKEKLL